MKIERVIHIESPIEQVFPYLENVDKQKLWISELVSITFPNGINEVGEPFILTIKEKGENKSYNGYTKEFMPPNKITIVLNDKHFKVETIYLLEKNDLHTVLSYTVNINSKTLMYTLLIPITYIFNSIIIKKQLNKLKHIVEQQISQE